MQLQAVEWSALLSRVARHEFDAASLLWSGDPRMDPTQIWHSKSNAGGSNYVSYKNREVDALIEEARVTLDAGERDTKFRRFGAILHEDEPYTFLFVPAELDLLHERIRGARASLCWWQLEDLWLHGPRKE
jgi:peptide/nickel transport system substrate-binding protein